MKKIGLITFFRNNYGSILQCLASKKYIESLGYECPVLYENQSFSFYKQLVLKFRLIHNCIIDKDYYFQKKKQNSIMRKEMSYLSPQTLQMMDAFVNTYIKPQGCKWNELTEIGRNPEYAYFITGSDQVWNATRDIPDIFFLRFCPRKKRIALATSLGADSIPRFNSHIKKYIKQFDKISVREESAVVLLKSFLKGEIVRVADPTFMFDASEWQKIVKYKSNKGEKHYLLLHFLNEPSFKAIDDVNKYALYNNLKVKAIGYRYQIFNRIKNLEFVDGDPKDYLEQLYNSAAVFTDSFHTTLFSINFKIQFFTYKRQYLHAYPQTSRISNLLRRFQLENHFVAENVDVFSIPQPDYSAMNMIEKERESVKHFIKHSVNSEIMYGT